MLNSNTKVSGSLLPFSCSAQSSTWVNLKTRSLTEVSYVESLVQSPSPGSLRLLGILPQPCWDHPGLWAASILKKPK